MITQRVPGIIKRGTSIECLRPENLVLRNLRSRRRGKRKKEGATVPCDFSKRRICHEKGLAIWNLIFGRITRKPKMNLRIVIFGFLGMFNWCSGQRRPIFQRPLHHGQSSSSYPCYGGSYDTSYDAVEENGKSSGTLILAAAVGGAALGYHLGTKKEQERPLTINNNIHNDYPPPCVVVQSGGGSGPWGGGGIVGGILHNHPILSNIVQGGWWNGGWWNGNGDGEGSTDGTVTTNRFPNRQNNINWNRAIRQFNRLIRPIVRGFR